MVMGMGEHKLAGASSYKDINPIAGPHPHDLIEL